MIYPDDVERSGEKEEEQTEQQTDERVTGQSVRHQTPRGRRHGRTLKASKICGHTHAEQFAAIKTHLHPPPPPSLFI